jgi:hypothetical protein
VDARYAFDRRYSKVAELAHFQYTLKSNSLFRASGCSVAKESCARGTPCPNPLVVLAYLAIAAAALSARADIFDSTGLRAVRKERFSVSWWKRFWRGVLAPSSDELLQFVRLSMQEWSEEAGNSGMRVWRNSRGDVLSLAILGETSGGLPELSDMTAVQQWFRPIAEERAPN